MFSCIYFFYFLIWNSRNYWEAISEWYFYASILPDKYKNQRMCDDAVHDCLGA